MGESGCREERAALLAAVDAGAPEILALARWMGEHPELSLAEYETSSRYRRYLEARDVLFLGRGLSFPIALEGALKLKEISYVHAEGYAAGEMKHGPIALIDPHVPVIVLVPRDDWRDKSMSNPQEAKAPGGVADRLAQQDALDAVIEAFTRDRDGAELETSLQALGVPASRVQNRVSSARS